MSMYDILPDDMYDYLAHYGMHFNKKLAEFAIELMTTTDPKTGDEVEFTPWPKERVDELLKRYGVKLENNTMHDYIYVANMGASDYLGSSVPDEQHLALYIKNVIDDVDAADGTPMLCWYHKMRAKGEPIDWEEML